MIQKALLHKNIYFYLLLLLAASLPFSVFATSLFQILLLMNWLIEGQYREKWNRLKNERGFWVYALFYLVHIIGMIWTDNLMSGLNDLKVKLPLIFIPFLLVSSGTPSMKELKYILTAFIGGNVIASIAVILALTHIIPLEIQEYRNASLFISHIRFSLMIVMSIAFSGYLIFIGGKLQNKWIKYILVLSFVWLLMFLVILRSLSGIVILILLILFIAFHLVRTVRDPAGRFMLSVFILFIPLFAILYTGHAIKKFYTVELVTPGDVDSVSIEGNRYINIPENEEIENGNYVWLHVCPDELEREWALRSDYPYKGKCENGSFLRFTLIRYMTSKGLRKDAVGMKQLDNSDIAAIERGIANYIYLKRFALYPRIYEIIWEIDRYKLGFSPNDKSLVQRYFYLRAGVSIAGENLWKGVGTGDVRQSFDDYYDQIDSPLRPERRRRAHNQYLTLFLTFGLIGGIVCLASLMIPVFINRKWGSYMTIVLFFTMTLSMLNEDTLETSSGVVLFGLFYAIFTFGPDWKWKEVGSKRSSSEH